MPIRYLARLWWLEAGLLLFAFIAPPVGGQDRDTRTLKDPDSSDGNLAIKSYRQSVNKLSAIIARPIPKDERAALIRFCAEDSSAIWGLGELRAAESAKLVIPYLTQLRGATNLDQDNSLNGFTAATALVRMGSAAIPDVIKRLEQECSELELRLIARILFRIDGQTLGRLRIQLALESARNSEEPTAGGEVFRTNLEDLYFRFNTPGYFDDARNGPKAEHARLVDAKYPSKELRPAPPKQSK